MFPRSLISGRQEKRSCLMPQQPPWKRMPAVKGWEPPGPAISYRLDIPITGISGQLTPLVHPVLSKYRRCALWTLAVSQTSLMMRFRNQMRSRMLRPVSIRTWKALWKMRWQIMALLNTSGFSMAKFALTFWS